ncbi:MAG TPA: hypothetical protein VMY78_13390 [Solirubrobacteraceae bacterium]|nr:hypothetical protein [Solirubrobacteraceae bacterium]
MTPGHRRASAAAMARAHVASLVGPVDLEPHEALQLAIALSVAEVQFFNAQIAELGIDEIAGQATVRTTRRGNATGDEQETAAEADDVVVEVRQLAPALHIWVKARSDAVDRLARFSKMALDANVDERRVRVQEVQLDRLAALINAVMADLAAAGLSEELLRLAGERFRHHRGLLEAVNGTAHEVAT